jgi:phage shock protein A
MRFIELFLLRMFLLAGLPFLLVLLVVGPKRLWQSVQRGWHWLWKKRLEPEEILSQVVRQHEELVEVVKNVIAQAEAAEKEILRNLEKGERNIAALEEESRTAARQGDDTTAREALFKLNLERMAGDNFREQLSRQRLVIAESRRRRFLLELQLRQYEVGRSILLSQLAEAQEVEQQYAIASRFDPFNAVADWQHAEGMVQEKALNARAMERVHSDMAEPGRSTSPVEVDPAVLDAQLAELRSMLGRTANTDKLTGK